MVAINKCEGAAQSKTGPFYPVPDLIVNFLALVIGFLPGGPSIATGKCGGIYRPTGDEQQSQDDGDNAHATDTIAQIFIKG